MMNRPLALEGSLGPRMVVEWVAAVTSAITRRVRVPALWRGYARTPVARGTTDIVEVPSGGRAERIVRAKRRRGRATLLLGHARCLRLSTPGVYAIRLGGHIPAFQTEHSVFASSSETADGV